MNAFSISPPVRKTLTPDAMTRRDFLGFAAAGALAISSAPGAEGTADARGVARAPRPHPPYRVWFQPRMLERNPDAYANMTLDASGWLDPRIAHLLGKTALDWVYGLNHPDARGPEYWENACGEAARSRPRKSARPQLVSAGLAIDEWTPPKRPENLGWLTEGLRAGRRANPDVFIAIWATAPTPELFDLGRDGTADLFIIEGYTHSVEKGLSTSWEGALRRCDAFAKADLLSKTIFCFGQVTAEANHRGERLTGAWLRQHAEEIKRRYPQMPGVAFYQHHGPDSPEQRELVQFCDRLSAELWPDAAPGNG